jgi:hypothetical protein
VAGELIEDPLPTVDDFDPGTVRTHGNERCGRVSTLRLMTRRPLTLTLCVLTAAGTLAACGSNATPTAAATPTGNPTASPTASLTAAQQAYAGELKAAGFFTGDPDWTIDADGNAICGELQQQTMSGVIAYEQQADENTLTGMTTKNDILTFIRDSVEAWCPQHASELPPQ